MANELHTICPVCGWSSYKLEGKSDFGICPCCAFEYGVSDLNPNNSFEAWRNRWIASGYVFRYPEKLMPENWGEYLALEQLKKTKLIDYQPHYVVLLPICPVCGWDGLIKPPYNKYGEPSYEICFCCGFEYGYTDGNNGFSFNTRRKKWIQEGYTFMSPERCPKGWGKEMALRQMENVKKVDYKPYL